MTAAYYFTCISLCYLILFQGTSVTALKVSALRTYFTGAYPKPQASPVVTNPPATQERQVQFLGWDDALEKGMAVHSRILAWEIPWTEEAGRLQSSPRS